MAKGGYKQRMEAYVKELVNPMSYYEWINKNTTIQGLPFTCDRYPFQKAIIDDVSTELHCIKPSQIGLCLDVDTPIMTIDGWNTMGGVRVGDSVYAPDGTSTKVIFKSEVYTDHPCYEITFSCGTKVVADESHKWFVHCDKAFNRTGLYPKSGRVPLGLDYARSGVTTTKMLFENFKGQGARSNTNLFYIPCGEPIQTQGLDLGINLYVLGLWLGNGSRSSGHITTNDLYVKETKKVLESNGFKVEEYKHKARENKSTELKLSLEGKSLIQHIKNVIDTSKDKYFNPNWIQLNIEDRLELLRGLIDSDGSISKQGRIEFYNTSQSLTDGFAILASSLGFKPQKRVRDVKGKVARLKNGKAIESKKPVYCCSFVAYSNQKLSYLAFKQNNLKGLDSSKRTSESFRRRIVDVKLTESIPVQCIQVDHPDHLFLCSESLITTHNTEVQLRKAMAFVARNPHRNLIYTMPDENMRKRVYQNRVLPILTQDTVFHELNAAGQKPVRSIEMTEINNSFMLMFPANEKAATSQPADAVFNDEIDLSDPQILALFNSRLQGSDIKINHNFSTPSYQGLGIDALYETSDQHEYMFKCPHCGFYQLPKFDSKFIRIPGLPAEANDDLSRFELTWLTRYNINPLDAYSVCCKCGKKVTYGDEKNHAWVAKYPHRTNSRGYKISPFSTRNLDAAYVTDTLIKYLRGENLKGFKNTVLGETHENSDERLPEAVLRRLFTTHFDPLLDSNDHIPHFIGIDMGKVCHVSIGSAESVSSVKYKLVETVKVEELLSRLDGYFNDFNIVGGFIDRLPLITESDRVRDKTYMKIMPMQYELTSGGSVVSPKEDEYGNLSYIAAHRTMHLDMFATAVKSAWLSISGYGSQKETIINHLRAMVRTLVEGKDGSEKTPVWVKKDKNDHYFHSMAYMYQAVYQHYNGYSFLPQQSYNSSIYLGTMDNFIVADHSLFGRK